jgi:hypothetical protein
LPFRSEEPTTIKRELVPRGGEYVVIDETETGRLVLPVSHIQTISGREVATKLTRQEEVFTRTKRLGFDFGKESANKAVSLKLFYFTAGLRWIPTYRISGQLKDKADIALQGEILNEIEDIQGAALDLVVGVPNFRFKENISPLSLERQIRNILAAPAPNLSMRNSDFSNALHSQYIMAAPMRNPGGADGAPAMAPELAGSGGEQDLFLYSVNSFSLKRGARATVPLWQYGVPLRHVYTFDLHPVRNRAGGGIDPNQLAVGASPLQISSNRVWHQLELTNNSTVPWTTGAAISMRENLPLGQDLLTYTPAGGCALLPLTVAVDMIGTHEEVETGRKHNAINIDNVEYTLIQKKGTITITSFRKEKSSTRISIATGGRIEAASDDGKIKINDFFSTDWHESGYHTINNHSECSWDLVIEPGQSKTLTYQVSFYVR